MCALGNRTAGTRPATDDIVLLGYGRHGDGAGQLMVNGDDGFWDGPVADHPPTAGSRALAQ